MPEGPEVQTVVNGLRNDVFGRTINRVQFIDGGESLVRNTTAAGFAAGVEGRRIIGVTRRGKFINIALDSGMHILLHLMMSGRVVLRRGAQGPGRPRFLRFMMTFDDGSELCLGNQRRWARLLLLPADEIEGYPSIARLGLDVLTEQFTLARFKPLLTSKRKLHAFLLDQSKLSGLGNIYVNEALFRAGLHPLRTPASLSDAEAEALYHAIYAVVREAVQKRGTSFSDFWQPNGQPGAFQNQLFVFQRADEPCLTCGTPIERLKLGNRSAFYCPTDQPEHTTEN